MSFPNGSVNGDEDILVLADEPISGRVLAIAGCTNSGKTTIAKILTSMVEKSYRRNGSSPSFFYNYDAKSAVNHEKMILAIKAGSLSYDYVIVEGNMLTEWTDVIELCDRVVFLTLDQDTCRRRRVKRKYDPPDVPGYFEEVVWPAYQQHLQRALAIAREDRRISFLDVTSDTDHADPEFMLSLIHSFSDDVIRICYEPLNVDEAVNPSCGATSVFVGTTRDTFAGRRVTRLDYESYDEMAYKELRRLCGLIRSKFPSVERIVIWHRIGEVAVGETSVIIATASPHRKDAIHATEMAIDELKRVVPIWKKNKGCQPQGVLVETDGETNECKVVMIVTNVADD
ncbi:molybdopterin converting factor, subunit 2 [Necator americanus]|uniref:Molybdopterin converting factor, subunit 2 n=1 Tax=Necator americanus TaxID=51031 RepID=W2SWI0_NECAM|nr:molybdopterin converting factor, subunit 2 [Necator americanus]ETN73057.1 molybdopterin converting factor, subunit 2 [Necator americanus]